MVIPRIFSKFQQKLRERYRPEKQEAAKMGNLDLLRRLSEEQGVSGWEMGIGHIIKEALHPYADEVLLDRLNNVTAYRRGEGPKPHPKVLLAAHMDEIGLMVTKIEEGGFLRFTAVGGIDVRTLPGQEVMVHGAHPLPGVIGTRPPHLQDPEEKKEVIAREEMYIDIGYRRHEEVQKIVPIGTVVTIQRNLQELANGCVTGKALDNRAGIVALVSCLQELTDIKHRADVYGVATVQEEVGVRGAIVSSYRVNPELALVIDVCHGDMPGVTEEEGYPLGMGPVIGLGPHVHPQLFTALRETAVKAGISYQVEPSPSPGGTDAWGIQIARRGIPTALVSIPLRYMHTATETLSLRDLQQTGRLLAAFIRGLETAFVEGLSCY